MVMNELAILIKLLKDSGVRRYKSPELELDFESTSLPEMNNLGLEPQEDALFDHLDFIPEFPSKK